MLLAKAMGLPQELYEEGGTATTMLNALHLQYLSPYKLPAEARRSEGLQSYLRGRMEIAQKDLGLALQMAHDHGIAMPVTGLVTQLLARVYGVFRRRSALTLPVDVHHGHMPEISVTGADTPISDTRKIKLRRQSLVRGSDRCRFLPHCPGAASARSIPPARACPRPRWPSPGVSALPGRTGRIAREAGLSRPNSYFHFPTKEHVLLELQFLEERVSRRGSSARAACARRCTNGRRALSMSPAAKRSISRHVLDLRAATGRAPDRRQPFPSVAALTRHFTEAAARGELRAGLEAEAAARVCLSGLFGLLIGLPSGSAQRRADFGLHFSLYLAENAR